MTEPEQSAQSSSPPPHRALALPHVELTPERRSLLGKAARIVGMVLLAVYFTFAAVILALRFWVLPQIEDNPDAVARSISINIGQRVSLGAVDTGWQGLRPYLSLSDVRVHDPEGKVALSLPSMSCTLSWESIVFGELRFHTLSLDKPELDIRRDAAGAIYVAGIKLDSGGSAGGFSQWLLAQDQIVVSHAEVRWDDELRKAPKLALADVNFVLRNEDNRHRFALRAQPPRELAAALDVRGDLQGKTVDQLQSWNGKLYAEFEYTDLAAWKTWVDYPLEIRQGQGGLRLWLGFADKRLEEITTDVALGNVQARLGPGLPLLEMRSLHGRLSGKQSQGRYEFGGKQVTLALQSGLTLPAAQFAVQWQPGDGKQAEKGDVRVDALELKPLAALAEYLPIPEQTRKILGDAAPQGSIADVHFNWRGPLASPNGYSVRGRFDKLTLRTYARLPGFSGISGNINGTEKGGNVSLDSAKSGIELPQIFADPSLNFDTLVAQLTWGHPQGELQLKFSNIAFANPDLAGTAYGSYTTAAGGPGVIDLTARLVRADARRVARYIPLTGKALHDWLDRALAAGHSTDASLRLKGDLKEFPFQSAKAGLFQVAVKVVDGTLNYAERWPKIDNISADVRIDGKRLELNASKASILGTRISNTSVVIADVWTRERMLGVNGLAEGETAEFLKFVAQSPVNEWTGTFTERMSAVGSGKLQLKLDLPLARLNETKVAGSYQFLGNQVSVDADWPQVAQVNGRLEFTESGISMRAINGQFLGGPVTIGIVNQRDGGIAVNAQGTLNVTTLRSVLEQPLLRFVSGNTAWRATMNLRRRGGTIVVESDLQGLASTLPAPLDKAAAEAMPLRFERTVSAEETRSGRTVVPPGDHSTLAIGKVVRIDTQRRREGAKMLIERSAIGLNEAPKLPESRGIVVNGEVPGLDLDQWLAAFGGTEGVRSDGARPDGAPLSSLNLKVGALDVFGKRINGVNLRAGFQGGDWLATIDARELSGDIRWRSQGKGRVNARLAHLTLPEATPGRVPDEAPPKDLPALDIVADNLVVRGKKLGRLELAAVNEGRDWRIEKLTIAAPDGQLSADGLWQASAGQQRTSVNVKIDVSDIGKYLERVGYPGSMQRGSAKLLGKLAWTGSPQAIDYPTLSGDMSLIAEKGQFLKVDPGVAKLLGILSLQALPRRITLDFRDVFSDGFAFDTVTGTMAVNKGIMHTQDFTMRGPSAQVAMSGEVDLNQESQTLKVRIVPSVGDSLSMAGLLLANPIAGIASFVAQRLLKDPLGQAFAFEYAVSGTWSDPKVEKITRNAEAQSGSAGDANQ